MFCDCLFHAASKTGVFLLTKNNMAEGKKSFIVYSDWRDTFDQLPDEEAGKLIKHIFAYVNDEEPLSDSVLINAVFAQIKNTLKRDLKKWDKQLEQRRQAGKRSAEARSAKSNDRSTTVNERQRNSTDNVNVSVNVNDSVKNTKDKESSSGNSTLSVAESFTKWFNQEKVKYTGKEGKSKVLTKTDLSNLKQLKKSYGLKDFEQAFGAMMQGDWKHKTPSHFLAVANFNRYLEQSEDVIPHLTKEDRELIELKKERGWI